MANFMLCVQLTLELRSEEGLKGGVGGPHCKLPAATLGGCFRAPTKGLFFQSSGRSAQTTCLAWPGSATVTVLRTVPGTQQVTNKVH